MAKIGEAQLKAQIKSREFSNVYMIYGEETYLKDYYVSKLKDAVVDPAFADFNFHQYDSKDTSISEILMDAEMLPMMSEYSFILVRDYPLDKSSADVDALKAFFKDVPQSCVLVFWYDTLEVNTSKRSSKWTTIENLFAKAGSAVNLEKRTESELVRLITSSAKKRGCSIDSATARYLISIVGSDIKTIFNELEKICGFAGEGEITKDIVDALAVKCLQAWVFDLSKFILAGNSDKTYEVLNTLFAQKENPVSILYVISSCYVDMYRAKCAKSANINEMELLQHFSQYRGKEFLIRNASRDCRNISFEQLRRAIDILTQTDELLKSTAIDKNLLLEEAVAKLLLLRNG